MEVKNIVTIDFDIIMAPSIELYNNFINEEFCVEDIAVQINDLIKYCNADLNKYSYISMYIFHLFNFLPQENIHFVFDHDQLYDYTSDEYQYNVINIDHHHDCGYPRANSDLYCGNWALKLEENNRLKEYLWLANETSSPFPEELLNKEKFKTDIITNYNLFDIPTPDILVICASFAWIPTQFIPLFYLWLDFYNRYFGTKQIEENPRKTK